MKKAALQFLEEISLKCDVSTRSQFEDVLRKGLVDARNRQHLACDFAEHVIHYIKNSDSRETCKNTISTSRRYADGNATQQELEEAYETTKGVANNELVVNSSAWAAVAAAITTRAGNHGGAVELVAKAAVDAVVWSVDGYIDRCKERDAEEKWQLEHTIDVLRGLEKK